MTLSLKPLLSLCPIGILMCSMCLTGMIAPLMQAVNNFTVTGLHVVLPVCITTQILTNTMSCVAFTTIAAMALDRAVAVTWHMRYFEVMTSVKCRIFLLIQVGFFVNFMVKLSPCQIGLGHRIFVIFYWLRQKCS